jgi:hypothetical protein
MSSFVYNVKVNAMQSALDSAIKETVLKLSKKYEFDYQEAIDFLGVEEKLRVNIGAKAKPLRAPKREQPKFPLPFSGVEIEGCCRAILPNKGLYSQCLNTPTTDGLCSSCFKKANNTPFGKPECGTIDARIEQGDYYKDPRGKTPTHFTVIMKKMNLTEEFVLSEVTKYNLPFDANRHFLEPEQTKRGRPNKKEQTENTKAPRAKKATNIVEVALNDEEDLVQMLLQENELGITPAPIPEPEEEEEPEAEPEEEPEEQVILQPANPLNLSLQLPEPSSSSQENGDEMSPLTESPKMVAKPEKKEKAKKDAEKEAKKQEKAKKEAEKEAKKQEKAKKEAEKEAKKQEKAKKEAEEEAKKQEKAKKEAEEQAKRQEKAKKEAEEAAKRQEAARKAEKVESDELSVENIEDEPTQPVAKKQIRVKNVTYLGVTYSVKEYDNTAYNPETKEYVGYWLPKDKTIVFEDNEEEDEEEDEELVEDSDEEEELIV